MIRITDPKQDSDGIQKICLLNFCRRTKGIQKVMCKLLSCMKNTKNSMYVLWFKNSTWLVCNEKMDSYPACDQSKTNIT